MSKQVARRAPVAQGQRKRSKTRSPVLTYAAIGLAVVLLLAAGIALAQQENSRTQIGEIVPVQGRQHIDHGASHPPYNSDPPTSGWHYVEPAQPGFYEEPIADETVIHNLEHGYVVMSYDCSKLANCEETKTQLRNIIQRYNTWKVMAVPRQNADAPMALTAWGRILKLDGFDESKIRDFINLWRNQGPEKTAN